MMAEYPHMVNSQPFEYGSHVCPEDVDHSKLTLVLLPSIQVKETSLSYHLEKVFNVDIPKLQHGTDGLIYTPVTTPYVPGTDINMSVLLSFEFPP
jgi:mRNA capping enzyme, catalytic domain